MSLATILAALAAVPPTAFLSGIFGMSGGMILMGVFAWLLPVAAAMMLHGVAQAASNGYRAFLHWRHIHWPVFRGYVVGVALTVAAFSWIAFVPGKAVVFIILGALPFVHYAVPRLQAFEITRRGASALCGVIVTSFQLLAGVSGPALDVFYVRSSLTRHQVVATKAVTQTLGHLVKLVYFGTLVGLAGDLGGAVPLWAFLAVIPLAFAGTTVAARYLDRMTDDQFRRWTQRLIMGVGLVFLARGLSSLL